MVMHVCMRKLGSPMTIHLGTHRPRSFEVVVVLLQAKRELWKWFHTCMCMGCLWLCRDLLYYAAPRGRLQHQYLLSPKIHQQ